MSNGEIVVGLEYVVQGALKAAKERVVAKYTRQTASGRRFEFQTIGADGKRKVRSSAQFVCPV